MTAQAYEALRQQGFRLAGGLRDLEQRACVYHHLFEDSGRRNAFALIAAHGALWASGYFKRGLWAGKVLAFQHLFNPQRRQARLTSLAEFADKFRDINRRVCAESYAIHHYTKRFEPDEFVRQRMGDELLDLMRHCHQSQADGRAFSATDRKRLYAAFFLWEQEQVVGPAVREAFASFHWQPVKQRALRPAIGFAYFGRRRALQFLDFRSQTERVTMGLRAYQMAEEVGLFEVERALRDYKVMPNGFFESPIAHFRGIEAACALP